MKQVFLAICLVHSLGALASSAEGDGRTQAEAAETNRALLPAPITNAPPPAYDQAQLERALRAKLSAEESTLVVNPLAENADIHAAALALTSKSVSVMDKARALCSALNKSPASGVRQFSLQRLGTAQEVFLEMQDTNSLFRCQEVAYLYVAMARAAGLKAFFVQVEEDSNGNKDLHACAAIYVNGAAYLADPTLGRVGVAHRKFRILDDVGACAVHLCSRNTMQSCSAAVKLAPDVPIIHEHLFECHRSAGRWQQAEAEVRCLAKLDPDGPFTLYARAILASHYGDPASAFALFQKAIKEAPGRDTL